MSDQQPSPSDVWKRPVVSATSRSPIAACLASQYAGWKVSVDGYFAMASGPIRAAIGKEPLFDRIGLRERPAAVIGLLESASLPTAEAIASLAEAAGVAPQHMTLLVAPTASPAGTLQVVAAHWKQHCTSWKPSASISRLWWPARAGLRSRQCPQTTSPRSAAPTTPYSTAVMCCSR